MKVGVGFGVVLFLLGLGGVLRGEESREFFDRMHRNTVLLAEARAVEARADLLAMEEEDPEVLDHPRFCYQRFFVELEGMGDRGAARRMLRRLDEMVASGKLERSSPRYRAVTEAWYRALFHADGDLPRQAHRIMQARLRANVEGR
jgi:hypothetical protein